MNNISHEERVELHRYDCWMKKLTRKGRLMSLGHLLEWAAQEYKNHMALECHDKQITYKELYQRACMFTQVLKEKGINSGDAVLVWLENSIEFYIAYFGVLQLGAIVAPLNVYLTEYELEHIINDADAKLIVTSKDFLNRLTEAHNRVPMLIVEDIIDLKGPMVMVPCAIPEKDPNELTLLLYTSGTTGLPKGVMISSANALINACQGIVRQNFPRCRVLCVLPLFHSFAQNTCIWAPLLYGCTVIVIPKVDRRFILEGLAKRPDVFLGVPALYGLLCLMKNAPIGNIGLFICGGDALPDKIRSSFALVYNRKIANGYGLTETSPFIAVDLDDVVESTSCVGRPCVYMQVEVRDEQNVVLPQGSIGRLWVKGPNVMLGYYNASEKTAEILKDGWLDTGDLAYLNKRGKIVIAGREKDLIINKGFNIYPQEIENILLTHPHILRAAVIGKPDPAGEVPIAIIQMRVDNPKIEVELLKMCKERLAAYKIPRAFIVMRQDPPLTATGKINKKALKKQLLEDEQH